MSTTLLQMETSLPDEQVGLQSDRANHARYICLRVLDALLREDVRACVSAAEFVSPAALPVALTTQGFSATCWLKIAHFGSGLLWIPVVAASFMQDWRSAGLPAYWQQNDECKSLHTVEEIVGCFARGVSAGTAALYSAFIDECKMAESHRTVSELERERWFKARRAPNAPTNVKAGTDLSDWSSRMLHYDRLGAFLDHPLYPTARAKLGFDDDALAAYGPEFQRKFSFALARGTAFARSSQRR